jgi:hypothetical protein
MEVDRLDPGRRVVMRSIVSPFPMRVTYEFEDAPSGTRARIRVEGSAEGFYRMAGPLLAVGVRRGITRDLMPRRSLLAAGDPACGVVSSPAPPRPQRRLRRVEPAHAVHAGAGRR